MASPCRTLRVKAVCAIAMAVVCAGVGCLAGAGWTDALLYGIGGGAVVGWQLADLTWWDVMLGFAESLGDV